MRRIPADQPRWSETLIFSLSFFFTTDIIAPAVNFGTKAVLLWSIQNCLMTLLMIQNIRKKTFVFLFLPEGTSLKLISLKSYVGQKAILMMSFLCSLHQPSSSSWPRSSSHLTTGYSESSSKFRDPSLCSLLLSRQHWECVAQNKLIWTCVWEFRSHNLGCLKSADLEDGKNCKLCLETI